MHTAAPGCTLALDAVPTLATYAASWLQAIRGTVAEQTWRGYRSVVRQSLAHYPIGALALDALKPMHVREWLARLQFNGKAPQTAARAHAILTILLNLAIEDEYVLTNVARGLAKKLHRPVRPRTSLDLAQLELFLELAEREARAVYPLIVALAAGGLRIGEAIALRPEDIHPSEPVLHIQRSVRSGGHAGPTKSKRVRDVILTPEAAAVLRNVRPNAHGWLFPGRHPERPISAETARKIVKDLADASGIVAPISPKTFRRSYAAVMKTAGVDIAFTAEQFGHSSTKILERYYLDGTRRGPIPQLLRPAHLRRHVLK